MKFNQPLFEKNCRMVKQSDIAKALNKTPEAVSMQFSRGLKNIKLTDFLVICELIDENPNRFLEGEN